MYLYSEFFFTKFSDFIERHYRDEKHLSANQLSGEINSLACGIIQHRVSQSYDKLQNFQWQANWNYRLGTEEV